MSITLPNLENVKILIIGDVMLDCYLIGEANRISPEAPVPVVKVFQTEEKPGGSGNVALNLKALGAQVSLIGFCGTDLYGERLKKLLQSEGINTYLIESSHCPTIVKQRVLSHHQQLLRMDYESSFINESFEPLLSQFVNLVQQADVVILSDYAKGTIHDCQQIIQIAKAHGCKVLIDPKGTNFNKYKGATLLTPNLKEFEAIVGACNSENELVDRGLTLVKELELDALLVTRGDQGMVLLHPDFPPFYLPAHAKEVFDVTGAGDTVISVLAATLAAKSSYHDAVRLANYAAAIVVGKLGAATVTPSELRHAIHSISEGYYGVVLEEDLKIYISDAKARGEKIVFTNGCFDLLHVGHIRYLKQAAKLGHRLIVAVNDDASVRKLKGKERPINTLERRMELLAAIDGVDWVVPFSEDTPLRLIKELKPDILVKGGDYAPENMVGAEEVLSWGGEVKALPFHTGYSTSEIVGTIQRK